MIKRAIYTFIAFGALVGIIVSCTPDGPETPTQIIPNQPSGDGVKAVELRLDRDSIPADGISTVEITAVCTIDGQEAPAGLPVTIEVDNGDLSSDGINPINPDTPTRRATVRTQGGGLAVVYLISPTATGIANITAVFADEAADTDFVSFTTPTNRVSTVELTLQPATGDAPLTVEATATVFDEDGNSLAGITVDFTISDNNASISPRRVETDSSGSAVTIISNVTEDSTLTATAVGRTANEAIQITNDTAVGITLTAPGNNADPIIVNEQSNLLVRATVTGESGNVDNILVQFSSTDPNTSMNPRQRRTDSGGNADSTASNIRGNSTITAEAEGFSDTLTIRINTKPVAVLNLITGSATAGQVAQLTYSAENSFDAEESFGDTITDYDWAWTIESVNDLPVTVTNTTNAQLRTFVVGENGGVLPVAGDKLTVILTVTDSNGLQSTATVSITFS